MKWDKIIDLVLDKYKSAIYDVSRDEILVDTEEEANMIANDIDKMRDTNDSHTSYYEDENVWAVYID